MTPDEYRRAALRTENTPNFIFKHRAAEGTDATVPRQNLAWNSDLRLSRMMHAILGMITELGELCDPIKRHLIYGTELDVPNLREERGDSEWYDNLFDDAIDVKLSDIWRRNIAKLRARFPDKFTEERAIKRDLVEERRALAGQHSTTCEKAHDHSKTCTCHLAQNYETTNYNAVQRVRELEVQLVAVVNESSARAQRIIALEEQIEKHRRAVSALQESMK